MKNGSPGFAFAASQAADGLVGDQAVAVGVVGHVGAFGGGAARELGRIRGGIGERRFLARQLRATVLREHVAAGRAGLGPPVRHAPRGRVLVVAVADVQDLAHRLGAVAVLLEVLGHGDRVGHGLAEVGGQVVDADGLRAQAGHQRVARRRADGLVAERPLEQHAARGQPVDVRRLDDRRAVAAQQRLEVVHADQQDVGPGGGLDVAGANRRRRRHQRGGKEENEPAFRGHGRIHGWVLTFFDNRVTYSNTVLRTYPGTVGGATLLRPHRAPVAVLG